MPDDERRLPDSESQSQNRGESLAGLLCALSFATSVALGERMQHGLRTAYIGLQLADFLGAEDEDREAVYYGALLKDTGCTSCGAALAAFFPNQPLPNADMMLTDRSQIERMMTMFTRYVPRDSALPARIAKFASFVIHCEPVMRESVAGHCEVAELFARRLGFGRHVQRAVRFQWERWDGGVFASGLNKDEAPLAARLLHLAQMVEFAHGVAGPAGVEQLVKDRSGARFDPAIGDAFLALCRQPAFGQFLQREEDSRASIIAMAPGTTAGHETGDRTDAVCEALADLADAKTGTFRHSLTVANVAVGIARRLDLPVAEQHRLRRAALLHDVGTVALPMGLLRKHTTRSERDEEQFQLHPHYTERILNEAGTFRDLAGDAAAHHERLDGTGYHRRLTAGQLGTGARVLIVADRYSELIEKGSEPDAALHELSSFIGSWLDGSCYEALVRSRETAQPRQEVRTQRGLPAANLSDREVEVLRLLVRGMNNPEIGAALVISRKTVEHHVEHIFNKLGVTSRTAAVAYAVQTGLDLPMASK